MDGAADVAETVYTPFQSKPEAAPVRLIVRRVKPTPGSQMALFATYSYHCCITDRDGDTLYLEADHRRHAEIENAIRDLKYSVGLNHLSSDRFPANAAWLAVQSLPRTRYGVIAHNLARWTGRIGLGEPVATTKALRRRFFALAGRLTRQARRLTLHLPHSWPWQNQFSSALERLRPATTLLIAQRCLTSPLDYLADQRQRSPRVSRRNLSADLARRRRCGPSKSPSCRSHIHHPSQSVGINALPAFPSPFIPRLTSPTAALRWIRAKTDCSHWAKWGPIDGTPLLLP